MSLSAPQDDEAVLIAAYHEQLAIYDNALCHMTPSQSTPAGVQDSTAALLALAAATECIAAIDVRIAPVRERWRRDGRRPGPALRHLLAELAERLKALLGQVDQARATAAAARTALSPQLDTLARSERMQRSYGHAKGC